MIYISFDIGVKNLAYCILTSDESVIDIIDWGIITLAESKKQIKGVTSISELLFCELDNLVGKLQSIEHHNIDYVIIENQPSNLNGIMKTIQYLIYSYFCLLKHWESKVGEIILINPSLKLQNHSFEPSSKRLNYTLDRREKYKYNKSDAIEVCSYYIRDCEDLMNFFKSHKKKDDLADTCIQTVSYIRKKGSLIENVGLCEKHFL